MSQLPPAGRERGTLHGPLTVALGASLWATDSLFRSTVVGRYSPLFIVFFNHSLCLIPALAVLWWQRRQFESFTWKEYLALGFIASIGSVVAMVFFTQSFATASNYTVPVLIQKLQPLFAIGLARAILKEKLPRRFGIWTAVAMVGAYFVSFGTSNVLTAFAGSDFIPVLYAMAAAAIWGATTVCGRLVLSGRNFLFMTAARFAFGAVFAFAVAATMGQLVDVQRALVLDLRAFLLMAFGSGLLALAIYYYGLKSTPAVVATLCELAFPVAAIVVNWVFLGTPLSAAQLGGAGLLLGAITMLSLANAALNSGHPT